MSPASPADDYSRAIDGQAKAADPTRSAWVAANAGSGKTKVLVDRVARLLLKGAKPNSILCVTYTKAAASEMLARLFATLGAWCVMPEANLVAALADLEQRPAESFTEAEIANARALFAQALETPGGLRIETIHAFCGRVLRRFPLEAGIAPGFHELDDEASGDLWAEALAHLGARVLERRSEDLIAAAALAAESGGLDGLRKAIGGAKAAIRTYIGERGVEAACTALKREIGAGDDSAAALREHAMGRDLPRAAYLRLLADMPTAAGKDETLKESLAFILSDARAEDRFERWRCIAFTDKGELRKENPYSTKAATPLAASLFQLKGLPEGSEISRIQQTCAAINARQLYERSAALLRLGDVVLGDFTRRKQARAGLDFDDLIDITSDLLTKREAAEWVLWKLDGGVNHVLLDEAQDTSPGQWRILNALTADIFAGAGAVREQARTLFVVGDQKQSIYSFQGADPELFLSTGQAVRGRAGKLLVAPTLAMSFRSVRQVLGFVDETFNPDRYTDRAPFSVQPPAEADYAPHTAKRAAEAGSVELWPLEPKADKPEPDPWDAPLDQESASSPRVRLAGEIAAFIRREIDRGAAVWEGGRQRPCRPGDFLILVRGRQSGLFDAVLQALKQQALPVAGADRLRLLDSLPVQDLLNLVRFVLCPEDDLVVAEILKGPFGGLGDDDLLRLCADRGRESVWERAQASDDARTRVAVTFLRGVMALRHEPPLEFFSRLMERAHPQGPSGWEMMLSRFGEPAREPLTALIDRAAGFDASAPPSLELFLAAIEEHGGELKRELSGPQDEVRVMTVHGAKGLQAPVVILPDTCSGPKADTGGLFVSSSGAPLWPGSKANDTEATRALREAAVARDLREHRRLLYVALTRAQDRLVICGARTGSSDAGFVKDSWYSLCLAAMEQLKAADDPAHRAEEVEAAFLSGGRTILRLGAEPAALSGAQVSARAAPALPAWLKTAALPAAPARRTLAPSALGGREPAVIAPFGADTARRLRRGRLIHALFEHLPETPPRSRRKAGRDFLARQKDLSPAQRVEMLDAAMDVIEDARFAALFAPGGRAEAPVIGELPQELGGDLIAGRVDRLVLTPDAVLVVDYKTDRPAPAGLSGVGEAYLKQMAAYRAILGKAWPGRAVRCLLAWTDGPKLMEIPGSVLDQALANLRN